MKWTFSVYHVVSYFFTKRDYNFTAFPISASQRNIRANRLARWQLSSQRSYFFVLLWNLLNITLWVYDYHQTKHHLYNLTSDARVSTCLTCSYSFLNFCSCSLNNKFSTSIIPEPDASACNLGQPRFARHINILHPLRASSVMHGLCNTRCDIRWIFIP